MKTNATSHPISYFKKYHDDDQLDLSPSFQRKPVWSDAQASFLVDSILNGLPIPEIFVRSATDGDGETRLEVVDGQQRLRAIIRFFSGDLELEGPDVTSAWSGFSWEDLEPDVQAGFWSYKIVTRELEATSDTEVREMFRRLNANQSSLNAQELRHSQYRGAFTKLVENLADDPWWLTNRIVAPAQVRRMADVEFISELLVGLVGGPLDKKKGLEDFYQEYDDDFPDEDYWRDLFVRSRNLVAKLVDGDFTGWRSKTEFYSLFLTAGGLIYDGATFGRDRLLAARQRLARFRDQVLQAKKSSATKTFSARITRYVDAATRASTDISRREQRIEILTQLLLRD